MADGGLASQLPARGFDPSSLTGDGGVWIITRQGENAAGSYTMVCSDYCFTSEENCVEYMEANNFPAYIYSPKRLTFND